MQNLKYRFTLKSRNSKTGPIPVTTTEQKSCPVVCPLRVNKDDPTKDGPCYAKGGPLAIIWKQTETIGINLKELCEKISALPAGTLYRHNQAGDLAGDKDGDIDPGDLATLLKANRGRKGFTYSHHDMTRPQNRVCVSRANSEGFTINLSANDLKNADYLADLKIAPVVVVLPESFKNRTDIETPKGRRVVVCPAITHKGVTCKTCQLCANAKRGPMIGFPAHGTRKNQITAA